MEKNKKYHLRSTELISILINKELEPYNTTYEEVIEIPDGKIGEKYWYNYYTFKTEEEYNNWKDFCIDILTHYTTPKIPKSLIIKEFSMFDLMWGLKQEYLK